MGRTVTETLAGAVSGQIPTLAAAFEVVRLAELKSGELYSEFEEAFTHVLAVRDLWRDLAADELRHEHELAALQAKLTPDQAALSPSPALATAVRTLSRLVLSPAEFRTLEDAFRIAHDLEYGSLSAVYELLDQEFITGELRRAIYTSRLRGHVGKLTAFTQEYGGAAWRRTVLAYVDDAMFSSLAVD